MLQTLCFEVLASHIPLSLTSARKDPPTTSISNLWYMRHDFRRTWSQIAVDPDISSFALAFGPEVFVFKTRSFGVQRVCLCVRGNSENSDGLVSLEMTVCGRRSVSVQTCLSNKDLRSAQRFGIPTLNPKP